MKNSKLDNELGELGKRFLNKVVTIQKKKRLGLIGKILGVLILLTLPIVLFFNFKEPAKEIPAWDGTNIILIWQRPRGASFWIDANRLHIVDGVEYCCGNAEIECAEFKSTNRRFDYKVYLFMNGWTVTCERTSDQIAYWKLAKS